MKGKILIVYYHYRGYPLRATTYDRIYSFEKYSGHACYYVNAAFGIPGYVARVKFDLIIFENSFLGKRNLVRLFKKAIKDCQALKSQQCERIALPQDEFYYTDLLGQFANEFKIKYIFSVAPETEWGRIYAKVAPGNVRFTKVLTGYLEDKTIETIKNISASVRCRDIDIGYRSTPLRYSLGRHGYLKGRIAQIFKEKAPRYGLNVDISTDPADTILGTEWYRFLLRCKYTIGVESGASLLDRDGSIYHGVNNYLLKHPDASFEETEEACFKGMDGNLRLFALGPRHLEACATNTCQILIEGEYNEILKPEYHYIRLAKDFSNIDEVLMLIKKDTLRDQIVKQAYQDIIGSGKWTYRGFVRLVLNTSNAQWSPLTVHEQDIYHKNRTREKIIWSYLPLQSWVINAGVKLLPRSFVGKIVRRIERG